MSLDPELIETDLIENLPVEPIEDGWAYDRPSQSFKYFYGYEECDVNIVQTKYNNFGPESSFSDFYLVCNINYDGELLCRETIVINQATLTKDPREDEHNDGLVTGYYDGNEVSVKISSVDIENIPVENNYTLFVGIDYDDIIYYEDGVPYDVYFETALVDDVKHTCILTGHHLSSGDAQVDYEIVLTNAGVSEMTSDEGGIIEGHSELFNSDVRFLAGTITHFSTYTITFNANGGGGTMKSLETTDGTFDVPECSYTYEGHTFVRWFDDEGNYYTPNTTFENVTKDIVLFAEWSEDAPEYFTVTFDPNGGVGEMSPVKTEEFRIVVPPCRFTKEGYTFLYWQTENGRTFYPGQSIEGIEGDFTLYAIWEETITETFVIAFDPNGGVGEMPSIQVEKGYNKVPPCDFTREGYSFAGWAVGSPDGIVINPGESVNVDNNYTLYALWTENDKPIPLPVEEQIQPDTIKEINTAMDKMNLSEDQIGQINNKIVENQEYISDDTGFVIYQALYGTTINYKEPEVAEAQKELVVKVVETAVEVDAGKATDIHQAQQIDKALPDNANFSVQSEIDEFYARQMYALFGGEAPSRLKTPAGAPTYSIDVHTEGETIGKKIEYLENEQALYGKMVDFVDTGVDHMGKAALKLRKCSGESVTVSIKSYVTTVKVSSFREFDKEEADRKFVEAAYKAILLSMQNEVISILEKDHKPSSNAEKEEQYQKELEAVKDFETFEIMVTEVLRQKYVAITGEQIDDVEDFQPIYWEIFEAWALDKPSPYPITLEELTQTTIDASTSRARSFTVNSNLLPSEWAFVGGVVGGAALVIAAAAIVPTLLKKKKEKEGIN